MKTSLAIVLATIALTFGAMWGLNPPASRPPSRVRARAYSPIRKGHYPRPRGPGPYSRQSAGCVDSQPASPWGGWLVLTRSNGSAKCGSPRQIG